MKGLLCNHITANFNGSDKDIWRRHRWHLYLSHCGGPAPFSLSDRARDVGEDHLALTTTDEKKRHSKTSSMMIVNFLLLLSLSLFGMAQSSPRRAEWMSGQWGLGYRIHYFLNDSYDVDGFMDQILSFQNKPAYVIVNLSGPAHGGDVYLAYNDMLNVVGNSAAMPGPNDRQLFDDLLLALKLQGIKVIAYMAGQGPALLKAGITKAFDYDATTGESQAYNNWVQYVAAEYADGNVTEADFQEAYADLVFEYAYYYGEELDGWWFDQGGLVDRELVELNCRLGNADAVVTFNMGSPHVPLAVKSPGIEDYTSGHPNPVRWTEASDFANYPMVEAITTESNDGFLLSTDGSQDEALGHMFMPISNTWNGIGDQYNNVWTESVAVDWMTQVIEAGGAWTWNVPRASNGNPDTLSLLRQDYVDFIDTVTFQVPLVCGEGYMCNGDPEYRSVCIVMDTWNQYPQCAKSPDWWWVFGGSNHNYCGECVGGWCINNPAVSDPCDDSPTCRFTIPGQDSQDCYWLRQQDEATIDSHCESSVTREICPESCQVCGDNCADTDDGTTITIDGVEQTCAHLEAHPELHDEVCAGDAWDVCFETCGNCNAEYIDLNPILECSDPQYSCNGDPDYSTVCIVMDKLNQYDWCAHKNWAWVFDKPDNLNYCGACQGGWCYDTPVETDPCDDSHYCEFTTAPFPNHTSETCLWLRAQDGNTIDYWCTRADTQEMCPETCCLCMDNCEDDDTEGTIVIDGVANNCGYLEARPELHEKICANTDAWNACRETCGNCNGEYILP